MSNSVPRVLILGANGQIARIVERRLLTKTDSELTLYLRRASRLQQVDPRRENVIEADVNDYQALVQALAGQDIVYANLSGKLAPLAQNIVRTMTSAGPKRLLFATGLGLYHEDPDRFGPEVIADTRRAAKIIEDSGLNYTLIRPAYMTTANEINNELTAKGTPFKDATVSRMNAADLILQIIVNPELHSYSSLGIDQAGTGGERPY
ncbi:NAD(P)H-binding protein [Lacticaseibacillus zhaodongensis]|uniref:NAD(P)H-binding protein n=1 Tax=Lacticaseibacillus zhaodongensis TaxID=2668065 RepID=UPI001E6470F5|nr:NAD(P)H-binding protein [Lacticaseibacillus zhaodongensis]